MLTIEVRTMQHERMGVIFIAVWIFVVFLYCIFRSCGGRIVDILSCDFCSGPLFDCWGIGGRVDRYDRDYPFRDGNQQYYDGYGPYSQPPSQLPPIVIVNSMKDRKRDNLDKDYTSSDDDDAEYRRGKSRRKDLQDPELRKESNGPLLLRSSSSSNGGIQQNEPIVV